MSVLDAPGRPRAHVALPARERLVTLGVVLGAMLAALALRLPYLHVPLGPDEGGLSAIAQRWGSTAGSLYGASWVDRPPLLIGLFKLAIQAGPVGVRGLGAVAVGALVATASTVAAAIGGHRAARVAAVVAGVLGSAIALAAVFTPAELLASVLAAASVGGLVLAHRRERSRELLAAGMLAAGALLIKQSFIDAAAAGAVFLAVTTARLRGRALPLIAAYAAGFVLPLIAAVAVVTALGGSAGQLLYALIGFRIRALGTLQASSLPLQTRVLSLARPLAGSGLALLLLLVPPGLRRVRDHRLTATLGTWVGAATAGVLAGGSYWPHYLIQLVAPTAVLTAIALTRHSRIRVLLVAVALLVSTGVTVAGAVVVHARPRRTAELAVARYVRARARPGDTQYVMYARADLGYYLGLPSPYPYAWSLIDRGMPGAVPRLQHLLASPRRPTWVVEWQPPGKWGLDPAGVTARLLHQHYRRVARIAGRPVLHRLP